MQEFACLPCRRVLQSRLRLRFRLLQLQDARRRHYSSVSASPPTPAARRYAESWYWHTKPPTHQNLVAAEHFFQHNRPFREWGGQHWKQTSGPAAQDLLTPEIIFLGRSNVGKSSLLNALTFQDLTRVSATPGATKAMAAFTLAAKDPNGGAVKGWDGDVSAKFTLVDMPGYGFGSSGEWGSVIMSYLIQRKNIRRAFLLVDAVHGCVGTDRHMMEILRGLAIPYQLVATKCDRLVAYKGESQSEVRSALTSIRGQAQLDNTEGGTELALGEIISVGALQTLASSTTNAAFGVQNVQWAVLRAAGLDEYAMQKAAAHGMLKNVPADEQESLQMSELSSDSRKTNLPIQTNVVQQAQKASVSEAQPPSSTNSYPDLTVEDFIREILNVKPAAPAAPTSSAKVGSTGSSSTSAGTERRGARIFDPLGSSATDRPDKPSHPRIFDPINNYGDPNRHESASEGQKVVDSALDYLRRRGPEYRPPQTTSGRTNKSAGLQGPREGAKKKKPQKKKKNVGSHDDIGARQPTKAESTAPALAGKGVTQGMDAFEATFAADQPTKSPRAGKGRRRN